MYRPWQVGGKAAKKEMAQLQVYIFDRVQLMQAQPIKLRWDATVSDLKREVKAAIPAYDRVAEGNLIMTNVHGNKIFLPHEEVRQLLKIYVNHAESP